MNTTPPAHMVRTAVSDSGVALTRSHAKTGGEAMRADTCSTSVKEEGAGQPKRDEMQQSPGPQLQAASRRKQNRCLH